MSEAELLKCADNLRQEVAAEAELEGEETLLRDAFTKVTIEVLVGAGEVDDGTVAYHQGHGVEVAGYNVSDDGALDLFITVYGGGSPPTRIGKADIDIAFRRLLAFYRKALKGYHTSLEEASDGFEVAQQIYELRGDLQQVRLFLFTDGIAATYERDPEESDGAGLTFAVWDITRLCRAASAGRKQEPIEIDVEAVFGGPIRCLQAPSVDGVYKAYLAIVPALLLSELYDRYRDRLLELNVRSFLQAKGKVNQGIRRTINDEPEKFLAYNNGITATAEHLDLCGLPDGGLGITRIHNLQIVNGGQTTASIHYAAKKDRADLSHIAVQAKIIVVPYQVLQQIVPLIARYSNTQNKVQEADFAANDSFHVGLEELSRALWTPSREGTNRQTRWFYERARGQYQQAVGQAGTPTKQKAFKVENPLQQKFTKTDLAKYENTWDQRPHIVSLGAQKNFRDFTLRLARDGAKVPDESMFHRIIAKAVLFKRAERLIGELDFGGYRANIVTYTLALLSHVTGRRLDLEDIWRRQAITDNTSAAITLLAGKVYRVIASPPGGRNVTEWCKKSACWDAIGSIHVSIPSELESELIEAGGHQYSQGSVASKSDDAESERVIVEARGVRAGTWMRASKWAKETGSLQPWQRSLAYSLGRLAKQGMGPSLKQAVQGMKLLRQAESLGFKNVDDSE